MLSAESSGSIGNLENRRIVHARLFRRQPAPRRFSPHFPGISPIDDPGTQVYSFLHSRRNELGAIEASVTIHLRNFLETAARGGYKMEFSRRTFLKGTVLGGAGFSALGFDLTPVYAQTSSLKIVRASETRSTCPYCSVSCGVIIYTLGDKAKNAIPQVVHVEGDPDHPINRGTLCPKGSSLEQDIVHDRRLLKP